MGHNLGAVRVSGSSGFEFKISPKQLTTTTTSIRHWHRDCVQTHALCVLLTWYSHHCLPDWCRQIPPLEVIISSFHVNLFFFFDQGKKKQDVFFNKQQSEATETFCKFTEKNLKLLHFLFNYLIIRTPIFGRRDLRIFAWFHAFKKTSGQVWWLYNNIFKLATATFGQRPH